MAARFGFAGLIHGVVLEYVAQPSHFSVLSVPLLLRWLWATSVTDTALAIPDTPSSASVAVAKIAFLTVILQRFERYF
jgi:hypothetical protein